MRILGWVLENLIRAFGSLQPPINSWATIARERHVITLHPDRATVASLVRLPEWIVAVDEADGPDVRRQLRATKA